MIKKIIIALLLLFFIGCIFYILTKQSTTIVTMDPEDENKIYYFGYGSNMDIDLLRNRIDNNSIVPVSYAKLEDYELIFPRGVGSVIPKQGHDIYGCLYLLTREEILKLDIVEGYKEGRDRNKNSYIRDKINVIVPDGRTIQADIYIQVNNTIDYKTSQSYKDTLVKGASDCSLPDFYKTELEQIEVR